MAAQSRRSCDRVARAAATAGATAGDQIELTTRGELVPGSELFLDAVETFHLQKKTRLSFVDVTIANFARHRAEGRVATFDRELGGFR
jgi:hypothetical protein